MTRKGSLALAVAIGLVLAGIVHISTVLSVPYLAKHSAYDRLADGLTMHKSALVTPAAAPSLPFSDPATVLAVCPFDLAKVPVRVRAPVGDHLLTLSFLGSDGRIFYGLSDRAAQRGVIDLVLMTRAQLDEALRADAEDEVPRDVRLMSPVERGLVIVRVLPLLPSERPDAQALALRTTCSPDPDALGQ